jgi:hypothetical protein
MDEQVWLRDYGLWFLTTNITTLTWLTWYPPFRIRRLVEMYLHVRGRQGHILVSQNRLPKSPEFSINKLYLSKNSNSCPNFELCFFWEILRRFYPASFAIYVEFIVIGWYTGIICNLVPIMNITENTVGVKQQWKTNLRQQHIKTISTNINRRQFAQGS